MTPKLFFLAAALTTLAACGGGGGGPDPEPAPTLNVTQLQGYWTGAITGTALGTATKARAIVRDDGRAWVFLHDASQASEPLLGLATATLTTEGLRFTGSGRRYPASGAALATLTAAGGAPAAGALTVDVASGADNARLTLAYDSAYATPATRTDAAAAWHFTKAGGTIDATWTVDGAGALTGSSTLGCTYAGSVQPHVATAAVYDVSVTESCTSGLKRLSGVARLNGARTFMTFGLVTDDGQEAEAFAAQKTTP